MFLVEIYPRYVKIIFQCLHDKNSPEHLIQIQRLKSLSPINKTNGLIAQGFDELGTLPAP